MDDCFNSKMKELLLRETHASGTYLTAIPGLTVVRGHDYAQSLLDSRTLSVVIILQGNGLILCKDKHLFYHENDYFLTSERESDARHHLGISASRPFLAFSLQISRHVLSLLQADDFQDCFQQAEQRNDASSEESIKIDLFNCFHRLIRLMDKPEQIAVRAPIIICEIHYLILISRQWKDLAQPTSAKQNRGTQPGCILRPQL